MAWIIGIGIALILLIKFPKPTLAVLGGAIVIGYLIYYFGIQVPDEQREKLKSQVKISVRFAPNTCEDPNFPLLVTIFNDTKKILTEANWDLDVYREGHSTNIAGYDNDYKSDKILQPGESWLVCYRLPPTLKSDNPKSLVYKVDKNWVRFQD